VWDLQPRLRGKHNATWHPAVSPPALAVNKPRRISIRMMAPMIAQYFSATRRYAAQLFGPIPRLHPLIRK